MGEYADMAWDATDPDDWRDMPRLFKPRTKTCKHCGQRDLRWAPNGGTYRLFDFRKGEFHSCSEHYDKIAAQAAVATPDDFEDLS